MCTPAHVRAHTLLAFPFLTSFVGQTMHWPSHWATVLSLQQRSPVERALLSLPCSVSLARSSFEAGGKAAGKPASLAGVLAAGLWGFCGGWLASATWPPVGGPCSLLGTPSASSITGLVTDVSCGHPRGPRRWGRARRGHFPTARAREVGRGAERSRASVPGGTRCSGISQAREASLPTVTAR